VACAQEAVARLLALYVPALYKLIHSTAFQQLMLRPARREACPMVTVSELMDRHSIRRVAAVGAALAAAAPAGLVEQHSIRHVAAGLQAGGPAEGKRGTRRRGCREGHTARALATHPAGGCPMRLWWHACQHPCCKAAAAAQAQRAGAGWHRRCTASAPQPGPPAGCLPACPPGPPTDRLPCGSLRARRCPCRCMTWAAGWRACGSCWRARDSTWWSGRSRALWTAAST
jgi:hypothetical protein